MLIGAAIGKTLDDSIEGMLRVIQGAPLGSSRQTLLDLHDFRGASILERNPVTHVCGEERFADRRNPTDGVRCEIEFVNADDGIGFSRTLFILHRHRCAESQRYSTARPEDRQREPMPEFVPIRPRAHRSCLLREVSPVRRANASLRAR